MCKKLILLCLSLAISAGAAPRFTSQWDESVKRPHHRSYVYSLDEDSLHNFDVIRLEPHLSFDLDNTQLAGYMIAEIVADEFALNHIFFRFTHSLTVDSVWADDDRLTNFTLVGLDSLQIAWNPPLNLGDTLRVGIAYHGNPAVIDSWGGFRWAQAQSWRPQIAYSMGDGFDLDPPPANYNWIPTHADPTDKVLWEAWFQIPQNRVVTTNGMRLDTVSQGDGTTIWHYRMDQPLSTYLLFISVSDYVIMTQRESGPLIENFVYPSRVTQAQTHFSNTPEMLDAFADLFGPYPFDRFGYCMTRLGDMEHATCVSHYDDAVRANHIYDWWLFHELAHMWWGDWVTCGDWRDLWLNEGFATYCEALYMEYFYGDESYRSYMMTDLFTPARTTSENFPIYDPDYYWGETVYEKGGCVMYMLRELLGDSAFFQAWREFGQEHSYGTAVTAEWQAKLEEHYGASLDWFFQPWVYGRRYPQYLVTLDCTCLNTLTIEQTQNTGTYFEMPMDLRMITAPNDTFECTVWVGSYYSTLISDLGCPGPTCSVEIDPYNKILKTVTYRILDVDHNAAELPHEFRISSVYPNPFNPTAQVQFDLPRSSPVTLRVFDLIGRNVATMNLGTLTAGTHSIGWDGSAHASGVYLFRLETPHETKTAKAVLLK